MSHAATQEVEMSGQLISQFFAMQQLEQTIENIIFELDMLPHLAERVHKPASICGLILDAVSTLVGQKCGGHFSLVEYEINFHSDIFPHKLKVVASIDSCVPPNAGYCCQIFAAENYPQLLAESHGTLFLHSKHQPFNNSVI